MNDSKKYSSFVIVDSRDKTKLDEDVTINITLQIPLKKLKGFNYSSYSNFKDFCIEQFNFCCYTRMSYNARSCSPSGCMITLEEHRFWEYLKERNKKKKQELLDEFIRMIENGKYGVVPGSLRRIYKYFEEGNKIYCHKIESGSTTYNVYYHGKIITDNINIFKLKSF